ncbi:VOC family protein [Pelomonas sp. CA6]|uniref:VOC family protein n=1 Tax=Pelomonas sp. CA6 TaxID=2907999 RepID=UPI001F4B0362|nr:VOC family protein [Pelomonas sp. CA6]MCH7342916.1 VOC family protein [Pelomonas sp. CA6]
MNLSIHSTFLPHEDPERSLAFYRDLLGLELRNDVAYGGHRWLTLGAPGQPVSLVLFPPGATPGVTEEEGRVLAEMMAKGTLAMIILATPDLDGVFEQLQARGEVEIVQEPTDQPYGVRDCAVRDPAGNMVRIQQTA